MQEEKVQAKDSHTIQMTFQNNIISLIVIDNESEEKYFAEIKGDRIQKQLEFLFNSIEEIHDYLKQHFAKGSLKITLENHIQLPLINKPFILKTQPFVTSEIQSLKAKIKRLENLRNQDAKTIMRLEEKVKQFDSLKYMMTRMQEDFNLFYFQPFTYKKLAFVEDPDASYRVKGEYLSIDISNKARHFTPKKRAVSIEAINYYHQPVFSFEVVFETTAASSSKMGLCTTNKLITTQMAFNRQKLLNFESGDILTMTVNKQKSTVSWFLNKKVIGRQTFDFNDNQLIFPYVQLERYSSCPQVKF